LLRSESVGEKGKGQSAHAKGAEKSAKVRNGSVAGVERVVAIDWSGRVDAAGQRRHIWAGVWTAGASVALEAGRTRDEVAEWLIGLARETPRMVVGIDCCFSFPGWFLAEHGCATVFEFWRHVADGVKASGGWLGSARMWPVMSGSGESRINGRNSFAGQAIGG
jgi:hypothetical protein